MSKERTSKAALADMVEALINDKNEEGEVAMHEAIRLKSHSILHEMDDDEEMDDEVTGEVGDEETDNGEEEECPPGCSKDGEEEDEESDDEEEVEDEEVEDDEMTESAKHNMMRHTKVKTLGIKHKSGYKGFKRVKHK